MPIQPNRVGFQRSPAAPRGETMQAREGGGPTGEGKVGSEGGRRARRARYLPLRAGRLPAGLAAVDEPRGLVHGGRHGEGLHHTGPAVQQRAGWTAVTPLQLPPGPAAEYGRLPCSR